MRISDWSSDVCSSDLTVFVELASELPAGAEFDPATMQLRWTPDNGQAGDYELRFRAVDTADPDNVLVSEIVVPVNVFNQNRRPVVQAIEHDASARETGRAQCRGSVGR